MPIDDVRRRARVREGRSPSGITFDLETGELSGSLGPSGAGRTTTMRILSALLGATTDAAPRSASRRRPSGGRR